MKKIFIQELRQIDNHRFTILWNDGFKGQYLLADLQRQCPCAGCNDEMTGKRRNVAVDTNVKATKIANVGQYAIKIVFTSGCSMGIYDYDFLYRVG